MSDAASSCDRVSSRRRAGLREGEGSAWLRLAGRAPPAWRCLAAGTIEVDPGGSTADARAVERLDDRTGHPFVDFHEGVTLPDLDPADGLPGNPCLTRDRPEQVPLGEAVSFADADEDVKANLLTATRLELRAMGEKDQSIYVFSYGVSDRGASIRIPISTVTDGWKGRLEDRRTASNADPYKVAAAIIQTTKEGLADL